MGQGGRSLEGTQEELKIPETPHVLAGCAPALHLVIDKRIRDICSLQCHLHLVFGSLHLFVLRDNKPGANLTVVVSGL